MVFWLLASILTAGACLAVMLPFLRPARDAASASAHDLEVYRDQLAELEKDSERGLIGAAEASEARAEIGRRILLLDAAGGVPATRRAGGAARMLASAAVLAVPLVSWGIYVFVGSPSLPDQRLAERLAAGPAQDTMQSLVARAERHLSENPSDARGWEVLAPIYFRTGRYSDAVTAYANAIRLDGTTAAREAGLGEALTGLAGGMVNTDAQAAFARALEAEPDNAKARFYIALGLSQEGGDEQARAMWSELAENLPEGSPWRVAAADALSRGAPRPAAGPGPTREDMEAAAAMPAQDRAEMIEAMVASLDRRLAQEPGDMEGWGRLMQSYMVLGRPQAARDALERGVAALGPGSAESRQLLELAAALGMEEGERP